MSSSPNTAHRSLLIGVVAGLALGLVANVLVGGASWLVWLVDHIAYPVGQVFLRLLFMLVIPLVFSALVVGISSLDLRQVGRLGLTMFGYAAGLSLIAVIIGMTLVNVIRPGAGLPEVVREHARSEATAGLPTLPASASITTFVNMIPDNPIKAAASGDMIAVIVFALAVGLALSLTRSTAAKDLQRMLEGLYDVMQTLLDMVLKLAPIGVAALLFAATAKLGIGLVNQLLAYVGVVLLALGLHLVVVYSIILKVFGGRTPLAFFRDVRLAMATAFATSSSSATLPAALKVAEEELRLPNHVSRFVLTAGSAMNQNGTALFEGVTVLFLAQLFEIPLTLGQQALVMFICILGGIGTAGVPAGSIPVIALILGMVGVPPEGLGLILGVDRLLDMCRTTVNVTGDLVVAAVVARREPQSDSHGPSS